MKNTPVSSYEQFIQQTFLKEHPLLKSSSVPDLSFFQRTCGFNLKHTQEQLFRLFVLQQHAFDAELSGNWKTADFFFKKSYNYFERKLLKDDQIWALIRNGSGPHGEVLRLALVKQLFLEQHLALIKSYLSREKDSFQKRITDHLLYINRIKTFVALPAEIQEELDKLILNFYSETGKTVEAVRYCRPLLDKYPASNFFIDRFPALVLEEAMLNSNGEKNHKIIKILKEAITQLESVPEALVNLNLYDYIALLKYHLAIAQGNDKKLAESLCTIEEAICFNPLVKEYYDYRDQASQAMTSLQTNMDKIVKQLGYNQRLNAAGEQLLKEAKRGFKLVNIYLDSDHFKKTKAEREHLYLLGTWEKLTQQAVPQVENWKSIASSVNSLAFYSFKQNISDEEEIKSTFRQAVSRDSELGIISEQQFLSYLNLMRQPNSPDEIERAAQSSLLSEIATLDLAVPEKEQNGPIPFDFWLASSKNLMVKAIGLAAMVLVVYTGFASIREYTLNKKRDTAYQQIVEYGHSNTDFLLLSGNVKRYLNNRSKISQDNREDYVRTIYERAFIEWCFSIDDVDQEIMLEQVAQFKTLNQN